MIVDSKTLTSQAEIVFAIAKESPLIPIFEYVKVEKFGDGALLTARNFGHSARVVLDCQTPPTESFCIHAVALWPILRSVEGVVSFELQKNNTATATVRVVGTKTEATVPILPGEEIKPDEDLKTPVMSIEDIQSFAKTIGAMSAFCGHDDGLRPLRQNILVGPKGLYSFDLAGSFCGAYSSETPFIIPSKAERAIGRFSGAVEIFAGDNSLRFQQGGSYYQIRTTECAVSEGINTCHNVILMASKGVPLLSVEVREVAQIAARAVLMGASSIEMTCNGDELKFVALNELRVSSMTDAIKLDPSSIPPDVSAKINTRFLSSAIGVVQLQGSTMSIVPSGRGVVVLFKNPATKTMAVVGTIA